MSSAAIGCKITGRRPAKPALTRAGIVAAALTVMPAEGLANAIHGVMALGATGPLDAARWATELDRVAAAS